MWIIFKLQVSGELEEIKSEVSVRIRNDRLVGNVVAEIYLAEEDS